MQIGPMEILVILVIALLIFGPNKLPEMARTVGRGLREVRRFQRMVQGELEDVLSEPAPSPRTDGGTAAAAKPVEPADATPGSPAGGNGASGNGAAGDGAAAADGPHGDARPGDPSREPD